MTRRVVVRLVKCAGCPFVALAIAGLLVFIGLALFGAWVVSSD